MKREPLEDRFRFKFVRNSWTGCWDWIGARKKDGYGKIATGEGRAVDTAHRVSWRLHRGEIPPGAWVLHKCDNSRCVNPDHLYLGDPQQNTNDMVQRGRLKVPDNRGERAKWAKLTPDAVRDIRTKRLSLPEFAKLYGVTKSAVFGAQTGRRWADLQ